MKFFSIRSKILINFILIIILFGTCMIVFAQTFISSRLHKAMESKGVAIAKRIAMDCVTPIITEQYFEVTMMLKDIIESEQDILYAYVLDESGYQVAHTFLNRIPSDLITAHEMDINLPSSKKYILTDKGDVLDIAIPLMSGRVGVLHLGISEQVITKDVHDIKIVIILFSLGVMAVGTLISFLLSWTITKPLLNLARTAEAYGNGEMAHSLQNTSKDEVGELAQVFNKMIERRRLADEEQESLIKKLQDAMNEIKTLSGFLPICATCKKIRDDNGYWNQIEAYIKTHSEVEFTHGICPDCLKKSYSDLVEEE